MPKHSAGIKADTVIALERPKQAAHGDFSPQSGNASCPTLKRNPKVNRRSHCFPRSQPRLSSAARLPVPLHQFPPPKSAAKLEIVRLQNARPGERFGRSTLGGKEKSRSTESVSANPTGPLHVGHGRGAALWRQLNSVAYAGWMREPAGVTVNDAGRQTDILALSGWLRYLDLFGETVLFPPNGYQGDYVRDARSDARRAWQQIPFVSNTGAIRHARPAG